MSAVAAIDIGGTKTAIEIDSEESLACERATYRTPRNGNVANAIACMIRELAGDKQLDAIGIGCPGPLDPRKGVILNPPNLSEVWWGLGLTTALEELVDHSGSVILENDCNLGALGEAYHGGGYGHESTLYLTISTGIGAGLVERGRIFSGSRGFAGELGHTTVAENGPMCGCGRIGCLEALASGTAIARRAAQRGWETSFESPPTARAVAAAAAEGDAQAADILEEAAGYLGRAVVNFLYAYDPEVVVLGGGVAQSDLFLEMVRKAASLESTMPDFGEVPIRRAKLKERSVICGARTLAERLVGKTSVEAL